MSGSRTLIGRDPSTGRGMRIAISAGRIERIDDAPADDGAPFLAPGLIDLQVNGYRGWDVNAASPSAEAISAMTRALAARGVTTWVPTVITGSEEQICARLEAVAEAVRQDPRVAAAVPFVHVEGPFLSPEDGPRGVHDPSAIRDIDAAEVQRWRSHGDVGYVTVSPHAAGAADEIRRIVDSGVAVAIGHTHAEPSQISAAVEAGATLSTHLGNGIFAELPRHPNAIWTQLADDRLRSGLIGDGHHLPADTFTAMARALGPNRAFLVSDAVELAGSAPGRYRTSVGGEVELTADGRLEYVGTSFLAGSAVDLAFCLAWVVEATPLGLGRAVRMATEIPGRVIGDLRAGEHPRGRLVVGARADLVLLDDAGHVVETIVGGGSAS